MFYADGKAHIEKKDMVVSVKMSSVDVNLSTGKVNMFFIHGMLGHVFRAHMWFIVQDYAKDVWRIQFDVHTSSKILVAKSAAAAIKVDIYNIFCPMMTAHMRGRAPW